MRIAIIGGLTSGLAPPDKRYGRSSVGGSVDDTLIWRVPLDDDLQKQGLASRSEFANLQAGGRGFESHHLHAQPPRSAPTSSAAARTFWLRAPSSCH